MDKKGFTLVEIIVVLVILAILSAICIPSVLGYVNDAREVRYIAEARNIYLVMQVEEAKYIAEGKGIEATDFYYNNKSVREIISNRSGLDVKFYSYDIVSKIRWNSNGKTIKANITKNKDIVIE